MGWGCVPKKRNPTTYEGEPGVIKVENKDETRKREMEGWGRGCMKSP